MGAFTFPVRRGQVGVQPEFQQRHPAHPTMTKHCLTRLQRTAVSRRKCIPPETTHPRRNHERRSRTNLELNASWKLANVDNQRATPCVQPPANWHFIETLEVKSCQMTHAAGKARLRARAPSPPSSFIMHLLMLEPTRSHKRK